ncbi:MAG TPA: hypothetical protein PKJ83_00115 [Cyclobacteriaceae bacterium]|nr:hypothetical protein [Cyclobacteriaceae bacterium]HPW60828.1 hypothetical protein [Cyclobacteriaceae bacterium]HRG78726.1 hypothetical protein [Cyclobacteriaceae bacterium]
MKKNLLDKAVCDQLIDRVKDLTPSNTPRWGEMNPTEMLLHCNICNRQILNEGRGDEKTTFKQYLLRIVALYIAPNFKRGIKSEARNITKGMIDNVHFEEQKKDFPNRNKPMTLTHPAFGNITAYKHMDHHLRQFGV